MPEPLREQFRLKASKDDLRFTLNASPAESFAVGRTGRKENPEALQGFHSPNLMFILDEASGIHDVVFEVAMGALSTPGSRVLLTSNPTRLSGYFYDTHHVLRDRYRTHKISCLDSRLVSKEYPEDVAAEYGEESSVYRVRVEGEFPHSEDDVIVPLDMLEAAVYRDVAKIEAYKPVWGLDVARMGACRSALSKRQSNHQLEPTISWRKRDLMYTVGRVVDEWENTPSDLMPAEILVDSVGMGAGVVDRLREQGLPVRGINVGETASSKERFVNLRAELYWKAREWFESKETAIKEDERLIGQLSSVRYTYTSAGKIGLETKEKMMDRGVHSPDESDSFVLTFAGGTQKGPAQRYTRGERKRTPSGWVR
jgi:hypothetical protein